MASIQAAADKRAEYQRQLLLTEKDEASLNTHRSTPRREPAPSNPKRGSPRRPLLAVACVLMALCVFMWWIVDKLADQRAEGLFLTTYYDPIFPEYYDNGNPHAPTVSQWLMLGRHSTPVTSWIADILHHSLGISAFGDAAFRPSLVPT